MRRLARLAVLTALALVLSLLPTSAQAGGGGITLTGAFADGATYLIEVPGNWNGTLLLYSHGYNAFSPNPARDVGDPGTRAWALANGFALAGSSSATTGWALEQAFPDQMMVLDTFAQKIGKPKRTIAWGHSLGGMITAGLVQLHPERFDGALPMCGVVAGGIGVWNQGLDSGFAFKTLLAPSSALQLVHISGGAPYAFGNYAISLGILHTAQQTAAGRARIALSAAQPRLQRLFTQPSSWARSLSGLDPPGINRASKSCGLTSADIPAFIRESLRPLIRPGGLITATAMGLVGDSLSVGEGARSTGEAAVHAFVAQDS